MFNNSTVFVNFRAIIAVIVFPCLRCGVAAYSEVFLGFCRLVGVNLRKKNALLYRSVVYIVTLINWKL